MHSLAEGVLKHYTERDADLYARCLADFTRTSDAAKSEREQRRLQWEALAKSVGMA